MQISLDQSKQDSFADIEDVHYASKTDVDKRRFPTTQLSTVHSLGVRCGKVDLHLYVTAKSFPPPQKYWNFVAKLFCGFSFWLLVFWPPGVSRVCHHLVFASADDLKLCVVKFCRFAWTIFWAWCQLVALYACLTLSARSSGASRELPQPLLWESPSWGDVNATSNPQIKKRLLRIEMDNCL